MKTDALIIGGGVAGLACARELDRLGMNTLLVEKAPFRGGHVARYACKATDQCQRCSACLLEDLIDDLGARDGVDVLVRSELTEVTRTNGGFSVGLLRRPARIIPERCNRLIPYLQEKLNAKIIHLIRHPVRWVASIQRWGPRSRSSMNLSLWIYIYANMAFHYSAHTQPWYYLVRHEDLVLNEHNDIEQLLNFCRLRPNEELYTFLTHCHKTDSYASPHLHETNMTKKTILDRWKKNEDKRIIQYANKLTAQYWSSLYQPLDIAMSEENITTET